MRKTAGPCGKRVDFFPPGLLSEEPSALSNTQTMETWEKRGRREQRKGEGRLRHAVSTPGLDTLEDSVRFFSFLFRKDKGRGSGLVFCLAYRRSFCQPQFAGHGRLYQPKGGLIVVVLLISFLSSLGSITLRLSSPYLCGFLYRTPGDTASYTTQAHRDFAVQFPSLPSTVAFLVRTPVY